MQSSKVEQFNRAGVGARGVGSTATGLGTPKARKNDMRSAREGMFGPGLWAEARNLGFILKASKETWLEYNYPHLLRGSCK